MRSMIYKQLVFSLLVAFCAACSGQKPTVAYGSSAKLVGIAANYPLLLYAETRAITEDRARLDKLLADFPSYPNRLDRPDWREVRSVIEQADQSGRSRAYAEQLRSSEEIRAFFKTERDDIARRAAGGVTATAEKDICKCETELEPYGAIAYAIKEGAEQGLEEQTRAANDGQRLILWREKLLGRNNIKALTSQADDVAEAANIAQVRLAERRDHLVRLLGEARDARSTLDRVIKDERAALNEAKLSKGDAKVREGWIAQLEQSRSALDPAVSAADQSVKKLDEALPAVRNTYQREYDKLLSALEAKEKAAAGR